MTHADGRRPEAGLASGTGPGRPCAGVCQCGRGPGRARAARAWRAERLGEALGRRAQVPKRAGSTPRYLLKLQTEVDAMQQLGPSLDAVYLKVPPPPPPLAATPGVHQGPQQLAC